MKTRISYIIFVAFLVRLVLLLIDTYLFTLPQGGGDDRRFLGLAAELHTYSYYDFQLILGSGTYFFAFYGSLVYSLVGQNPFFLTFLNVIYGTLTVYYIYKGSLLLWENEANAKIAAWIATFFPQLAMVSALFLREAPLALLLSIGIYHLIRYWKYSYGPGLFVFIVTAIIGTLLHSGTIFALVGFLTGMLLLNQEQRTKVQQWVSKFAAVLLVVIALIYMSQTGYGMHKFGTESDDLIGGISSHQESAARGGAGYPAWLQVSGTFTDAILVPVRMIALLFSPLIPFLVRSPAHLVGVFDALFYLFLAWNIYKYRHLFLQQNRTAKLLLFVLLAMVLVYSLGTSNFGTAIRHRGKIAPILITLFFSGKVLRKMQKEDEENQPYYPER